MKIGLRSCMNLAGVLILLVGMAAAIWVFATAADDAEDAISYEIIDGKAYPVAASDSKIYRHDLERIGGKAAIFADDLNRWFRRLWRGRRLAFVLAALAIAGGYLCFHFADRLGPELENDQRGKRQQERQ